MNIAASPPLEIVTLPEPFPVAPADILALIEDAEARVDAFHERPDSERIPAFVPSNPLFAFGLLASIVENDLATGLHFCEWGSGFGTVTCLAARLGLCARGIEIEKSLVNHSRSLARDHAVSAQFHLGSYKPKGVYQEAVDCAGLDTALGFSPLDFDIIYVYPWPAEERVVSYLFREFGRPGSLLVAYLGGVRYRIFRKPLQEVAPSFGS